MPQLLCGRRMVGRTRFCLQNELNWGVRSGGGGWGGLAEGLAGCAHGRHSVSGVGTGVVERAGRSVGERGGKPCEKGFDAASLLGANGLSSASAVPKTTPRTLPQKSIASPRRPGLGG